MKKYDFCNKLTDSCDWFTSIANVCCTFTILLLVVSINGTGLSIGIIFNNETCYDSKLILSLSTWLIITTSGEIISIMATIMLLVFFVYDLQKLFKNDSNCCNNLPTVIFVIFLCLMISFSLGMATIGTLELIFQFSKCKDEVLYVCIAVIVILITNILQFFGLACGLKVGKKGEYSQL